MGSCRLLLPLAVAFVVTGCGRVGTPAPPVTARVSPAPASATTPASSATPTAEKPAADLADDTVAPTLGADEAAALHSVDQDVHRAWAPHPDHREPISYGATGDYFRANQMVGGTRDPGPDVGSRRVVGSARPAVRDGASSAAGLLVARRQPSLRRCYALALNDDPEIRGFLDVDVQVGADGSVATAEVRSRGNGNVPPGLLACIRLAVMQAAPEPGAAGERFSFAVALQPD